MQIDFSAPINGLDGQPIRESAGSDRPATLGSIAIAALLTPLPAPVGFGQQPGQPEQLDALKKVEHATLAQAIHGAGQLDLTVEQVASLKDRIGRMFDPLVVMRAFALLEGKA